MRVTDRGPFQADRIIDLSYATAYRLGYINTGSTLVEIESVPYSDFPPPVYAARSPLPASTVVASTAAASAPDEIEALAARLAANDTPTPAATPAPAAAPPKGVYLQLGAFSSADNAEALRGHLSRELDWLNEGIQINFGGGLHRVHLGPFANRAEAEKVAERIRLALGFKSTIAR